MSDSTSPIVTTTNHNAPLSDVNSNGTSIHPSIENAKNTVVDTASNAYNAAANHPVVQNAKETLVNGPVVENVKEQAAATSNEFSNLAASRQTPSSPAATGQQLTHYHSFFSTLLSWKNPRASAIAYISIVLFIFGARYLNLLRYAFKLTWMTLGVTVLAEIAGKSVLGSGLTSSVRPRKYYVLPKDTLDAMLGDVHELLNFFVIESQRIVFAENILNSTVAFFGAFLAYFLIKIVPLWGMALISTSALFLVPLVYTTNKELIDHHIQNISDVVNQQTTQVKQLASRQASIAAESTKQYASEYSAKAQEQISKAQELIGARARSVSPSASAKPVKTEPTTYKPTDFPAAPKEDFKSDKVTAPITSLPAVGSHGTANENEPLLST